MKKVQQLLAAVILTLTAVSSSGRQPATAKPKIVIGMMVDQMRWDLQRSVY